MIGSKLQGRLGNQMFQYAFAYIASQKRGEKIFIISGYKNHCLHYFELEGSNITPLRNAVLKLFFFLRQPIPKTLIQYGTEDINLILKESESCQVFDGYFQSELYFKNSTQTLKNLFKIKEEHKRTFEKKYKALFETNKTIVVHIRRTDYIQWDIGARFGGENLSLPFSYTETLLKRFDLAQYKVIFISDDIKAVKEHFGGNENFYYENNPEIIDLQIMLHGDVLCISNSSFSWWGAYLNEKPHKQVYAPKYWLGFKTGIEYPKDVICHDWHQLDVIV